MDIRNYKTKNNFSLTFLKKDIDGCTNMLHWFSDHCFAYLNLLARLKYLNLAYCLNANHVNVV